MLRRKNAAAIISMLIASVAVMLISASVGAVKVPLSEALKVLAGVLPRGLRDALGIGEPEASYKAIIELVRLPRIMIGYAAGAALGAAGACYQGLLANPLADPYIIGVSSGAAFGASLGIVMTAGTMSAFGPSIPLFAFAGALISMMLVMSLAQVKGKLPPEGLLLSGVVVGSFIWALVSFTMLAAGEDLSKIMMWLMGSLSARNWGHFLMSAPYIAVGIAALMLLSRGLNLISMGEEQAKFMGLSVEGFKRLVIVAASLVTAAAVGVAGIIGFVGLIVPHMARYLVGPDHRVLIPVSALGGGVLLVAADTAARMVISPAELPVGTVTALVGAPFFFYLLRRSRAGGGKR